MQPSIAITLIVCGTIVAGLPIVAHLVGVQLHDRGFLCYLVLATCMIASGIVGAFRTSQSRSARGFEPLPVTPAM